MIARKITIWIRGDDEVSAEEAFDEAVDRLKQGNTSGNDVSEADAFYFSNDECPAEEVPHMGWPKSHFEEA